METDKKEFNVMKNILVILLMSLVVMQVIAREEVIEIYDGDIPGSEDWNLSEQEKSSSRYLDRSLYGLA